MTEIIFLGVLIGASILSGYLCARHLSGLAGWIASAAIPWFGVLFYLLFVVYVLNGGGASMWPAVQLIAGTVAAVVGVIAFSLFRPKK